MSYEIQYTDDAGNDLKRHRKSGNKKVSQKINMLINEQLKHYKIPTWSRRISAEHRLIYRIEDKVVTVLVLSAYGHYGDR